MKLNNNLRMLDIDDLIFMTMKLEGHQFYAISLRLGVTQPALSMRKQKIETHLGPGIFVRKGRNINLTEIGARLATSCRFALKSLDAGTREAEKVVG